ncbi:MAG: leucine-rich repeat domain-containing protein [Clostridia bacterium]|nr:leucine-rich repeat domain-containing protein [Clostridia bacterium]
MKKSIVALLAVLLVLFLTAAVAETSGFLFDPPTGSVTGWTQKTAVADIHEEIGGVPVTNIAPDAFRGCSELETVCFPASIETISINAFADCSALTYLVFDAAELPSIDSSAFSGCPLADVDLPWNATREAMDAAQRYFSDIGSDARVWRGNYPMLEVLREGYLYEEAARADTYALTAYTGTQTAVYPHYNLVFENGDEKPVVALGESVFSGQTQLKMFAVPHSDLFTTIGDEAFADSGLEWIDLYDTVTGIGRGAFRNCIHLQSLSLTPSIRKIGAEAFAGCSGLTDLYIGCETSALPKNAFQDCTALTNVTIDSETVPDKLFTDLPVSSISFGNTVEKIGAAAFQGTSITELVLPETLTSIGSKAFDDCHLLESVTIRCDADILPADAFKGCINLKSVTIAKGSIPDGFLKDSTIQTLVLGDEVSSIGKNAFSGTKLSDVLLPAKVSVSQNAFLGVPHEQIRIADTAQDSHIEALGQALNRPWYLPLQRASDSPALQDMPELATNEDHFLFDASTGTVYGYTGNEKAVAVPRQIDGIDVQTIDAFGTGESVSSVQTLIIPETVTKIGTKAFADLSSLQTVLCYGPLESLGEAAFSNCTALKTVLFINGIYQIDAYAFDGCTQLKELWWRGKADRIGEYALRNTGLEVFALEVRRLDKAVFQNCALLSQVHIRNGIQRIDTNLLDGCNGLEKLCFETSDCGIFKKNARIGSIASSPAVVLPADIKLKDLQGMYKVLATSNYGIVDKREDMVLSECSLPEIQLPDIDSILSQLPE